MIFQKLINRQSHGYTGLVSKQKNDDKKTDKWMNKETNDRVTSKSPHRTLPPHTPVSHKVVPGSTLGAQSSFLTLLLRVSRTQRPPIHERTHKSTPFRAKRVRSWRVLRRSAPSQPRWGRRGSSFFSLTMAFRRGVGASQTDRDSER